MLPQAKRHRCIKWSVATCLCMLLGSSGGGGSEQVTLTIIDSTVYAYPLHAIYGVTRTNASA